MFMDKQNLKIDMDVVRALNEEYMDTYFHERWESPGTQKFKADIVQKFQKTWNDPNIPKWTKLTLMPDGADNAGGLYPRLLASSEKDILMESLRADCSRAYECLCSFFNNINRILDTGDSINDVFDEIDPLIEYLLAGFFTDGAVREKRENCLKIISLYLWLRYPDRFFLYNPFSFENLLYIVTGRRKNIRNDAHAEYKTAYLLYNVFAENLKTLFGSQRQFTQEQYIMIANDIEYFWSNKPKDNPAYYERALNIRKSVLSGRKFMRMNADLDSKNHIYYGIPGCGKSHKIKAMLETKGVSADSPQVERVVFYPDYTYSDFVGCLLPHRDDTGNLDYQFTPGPFARILKRAVQNMNDSDEALYQYYLIIEELNRGNAPAIFGDLFQLLDRDESGRSEYPVSNADISRYVFGDKSQNGNRKVYLPENLAIYATMNTSDQNIFRMDTAFQRRWSMLLITEPDDDKDAEEMRNIVIPKSQVTWGSFVKAVNAKIAEQSRNAVSTEDKRIGVFFAKKEELEECGEDFPFVHKVLKYLWDDVFKTARGTSESIFKDSIMTFDEIVRISKVSSNLLNDILKYEIYVSMTSESADSDD